MFDIERRARAITLLGADPLRHIVSLKMLERIGERVELRLVEAEGGWALLSLFSSRDFEYDAHTYGPDRTIALIEGNCTTMELALLEVLPAAPLVIKTSNAAVQRYAVEDRGATPVAAFASFTAGVSLALGAPEPVASSAQLTGEMAALFEHNHYGLAELERYFANGARWFALEQDGTLAAACFVYRKYGHVWEIAGVHTAPSVRRQGLASRVVRAALRHLRSEGLQPRYQVAVANAPSMKLARSIGLTEFLRIEHLLLPYHRSHGSTHVAG